MNNRKNILHELLRLMEELKIDNFTLDNGDEKISCDTNDFEILVTEENVTLECNNVDFRTVEMEKLTSSMVYLDYLLGKKESD